LPVLQGTVLVSARPGRLGRLARPKLDQWVHVDRIYQ